MPEWTNSKRPSLLFDFDPFENFKIAHYPELDVAQFERFLAWYLARALRCFSRSSISFITVSLFASMTARRFGSSSARIVCMRLARA